jgi:hypothetical protein
VNTALRNLQVKGCDSLTLASTRVIAENMTNLQVVNVAYSDQITTPGIAHLIKMTAIRVVTLANEQYATTLDDIRPIHVDRFDIDTDNANGNALYTILVYS